MTSIRPSEPSQRDVVAGLEKFINHKDNLSPAERKAALGSVLESASSVEYETRDDAYELAPPLSTFRGPRLLEGLPAPRLNYRYPGIRHSGPHEAIAEHRVHKTAVGTDALFCDVVALAESVKTEFNGSLSVNQKEAFNDLLGQYRAMKTIMFPSAAKDLAQHRAESDA